MFLDNILFAKTLRYENHKLYGVKLYLLSWKKVHHSVRKWLIGKHWLSWSSWEDTKSGNSDESILQCSTYNIKFVYSLCKTWVGNFPQFFRSAIWAAPPTKIVQMMHCGYVITTPSLSHVTSFLSAAATVFICVLIFAIGSPEPYRHHSKPQLRNPFPMDFLKFSLTANSWDAGC